LATNITNAPLAQFPPPIDTSSFVSVSFSPQVLELFPGASGNLTAVFSLLNDIDEPLMPVYSGYITLSATDDSDTETFQIPYMGVASNMTVHRTLGTSADFPVLVGGNKTLPANITNPTSVFTMSGDDQPAVAFQLYLPSRVVRLLVLPPPNSTAAGTTTFLGLSTFGYLPLKTKLTSQRC
jgi:hypothetical protein